MTAFVSRSTTKRCGYSSSVRKRSQKRKSRLSLVRALTFDFSRASSAFLVSAGDSAPATTWAAKTMRLPSGSHFGLATEVGMSVTRSASPPSSGST